MRGTIAIDKGLAVDKVTFEPPDIGCVLYLPLYLLDAADGQSFMSKDKYGHLCTVTGAIWTPQGRTADGNDKIVVPTTASIAGLSPLSILVWAKSSNTEAAWRGLVNKYATSNREWLFDIWGQTAAPRFRFIVYDESANANILTEYNGSDINDGSWHLLAGTWDGGTVGSGIDLYRDAILLTTTDGSTGTLVAIEALAADVQIFTQLNDASYYIGDVGGVWICNKKLTPLEIQNIYLATKWRYQ